MDAIVNAVNAKEKDMQALSDEELKGKTAEFKARLEKGETLDDILVDAFATVREVAVRIMGMRHYDVQLIGGTVIHQGKIAEMRTGEGKTLVATLPVYLNALEGKGIHVITVNDYLAKRDAVWMGQIYDFLGLRVGIIQNQRVSYVYDPAFSKEKTGEGEEADQKRDELGSFKVEDAYLRPSERKEAYECDITYGTNNEFGFDYLRDNMVQKIEQMVMRSGDETHFAVIDEIDSILIDESRTPLIISAPAEEATDQYYRYARLVTQLDEATDYNVDEKLRSATLTEEGIRKFEQALGVDNIYAEGGIQMVHHVEQALKAETLFKRDKDYVVEGEDVVIIDSFTGRKMPGRRYSGGLHQAIEAKEGMPIKRESKTLATITFQNLFRMYGKLAGMTGTAVTEEEEFQKIYDLDVIVIPTNEIDKRVDHPDRIYKTDTGKHKAIIQKINEAREKGQPVLVGTISVEKNEELGMYLTQNGVEHEILNAKNHEREGEIIAQAGRSGSVTLATNIAGRGVDIKLGGIPASKEAYDKVVNAGGLFVLGSERHESRRIDNQLRGRSARQGDPGETQFFVSTDDDLMRVFAGDRLKSAMDRMNVPDDMPIEQRLITRMLEGAQKKVEGHHFDVRKHVLEYDEVLNRQRAVIYGRRRQILALAEGQLEMLKKQKEAQEKAQIENEGKEGPVKEKIYSSLKEMILEMIESEIEFVVSYHTTEMVGDQKNESENGWNTKEILETMKTIFPFTEEEKETLLAIEKPGETKLAQVEAREKIVSMMIEKAQTQYSAFEEHLKQVAKENELEEEKAHEVVYQIEKGVLLRAIDTLWVNHLVAINHLRAGIGLRGYGQRDPLIEYKKETFHLFNELLSSIQKEVVYSFFKVGIGLQVAPSIMANDKMTLQGAKKSTQNGKVIERARDEEGKKVGRNDPCPCGSGKKYKKCHGS